MQHKFRESFYMGQDRNACLECGRTKESHVELQLQLNPREEADKFLKDSLLSNHPLHDMFLNILEQYIIYKKKE